MAIVMVRLLTLERQSFNVLLTSESCCGGRVDLVVVAAAAAATLKLQLSLI